MNPSSEAQSGLSYASACGSSGASLIRHCGPAGGPWPETAEAASHCRPVGRLVEKKGFAYPAAALAAADVIVVPSVVDRGGHVDGLPNTLLEPLPVGRPVVASRVAGIPDVVEDERHGPARAAGRSRGVGGGAALGPPVVSIFSSRPTPAP